MRRKEIVRNYKIYKEEKMKEQKHDLVPDENPSNDQPGWFKAIKQKSTICEL